MKDFEQFSDSQCSDIFVSLLKESKWTYSKKRKKERKEKQKKDKVNLFQRKGGSPLTWGRSTKKETLLICATVYRNNYGSLAGGPWGPYHLASVHHLGPSPLVPTQTTHSGQTGILFILNVPCTFLLCTWASGINKIWNVLSTLSDPTNHNCQNLAHFKSSVTSKKPSLSPQRDVILFSMNTLNTVFVSYIVLKNSFCIFEVGIHAIPSVGGEISWEWGIKSCSSLQPPERCFTCSKEPVFKNTIYSP